VISNTYLEQNIFVKKVKVFFLLMVSLFILSGCDFFTNTPQATITSIEVDLTTLEENYDIDTFDLSSISIKVSFSDGKFQIIPITEAMLSSEHLALLSNVGEHEENDILKKATAIFAKKKLKSTEDVLMFMKDQLDNYNTNLM